MVNNILLFAVVVSNHNSFKLFEISSVIILSKVKRKFRYRIDVSLKRRITLEQIEMYSDSGWDYVTGYQFF